jgi:hypothetical protein
MYSEAYRAAKKEFINCICMTLFGLGIPLVLAFTEWYPIMRAEKKKAKQAQQAQ